MSWEQEDFIVYSELGVGIMKVSSKGGTPEIIVDSKTEYLADPQILPDGKSVMYTIETGQPRVMVKLLKTEEPKELFAGKFWQYLPSGHITYWDNENNLCAVHFDLDRLEPIGGYVSMIPNVYDFAISNSGTLIYTLQNSQGDNPQYTLVWVDRDGKEESLNVPPNAYAQPKVSPDKRRIALAVGTLTNEDIYIWDIERNNLEKLTLEETREIQPIWTPDSNRIIYLSTHEDPVGGIYWRPFDGSGKIEKLASASDRTLMPWSISRDGKVLLLGEVVSMQNVDVGMVSMDGDHERKTLLQEEYIEAQPSISPDGQWVAYASNESSRDGLSAEIYIRSFPDVDKIKRKVSTGGGNSPLWSPDGKEIFYLSADNYAMSVAVKTEPTLNLGAPEKLFQSVYLSMTESSGNPWDIHPDGDRFLMIKPPPGVSATVATGPRKINIVLNWDEELKERAPGD
jgi:Tol biopolymer transport system component